jgi:hypothetical protein
MTTFSKQGYGNIGFCKLCSVIDPQLQDKLDARVGLKKDDKYVYSASKINDFLVMQGAESVQKRTIYNHREHVAHPKDRMVSAVEKHEAEHGVQPQMVDEEKFLDTLIAIGQRKIEADPGAVSIADALKAVGIKKSAGKAGNAQAVLVQIMTGGPSEPTVVVEGEVQEIP